MMVEQILATAQAAEASRQIVEAERLCDEALRVGRTHESLVFAARIARRKGDIRKSAEHLKAAFKLQPSPMLRLQVVAAFAESGDLHHAAQEALEGLEKQPRDVGLLNVYGVVLKMQGRYREAITYFTRATKLAPSVVAPWGNLGNTWMQLDNPARAADCYLRATRLEPLEGEHFRCLANAHARLKDYDKALGLLQKATKLSPQNTQIKIDIARIFASKKDYAQALAEIENVLVLFPRNPEALRDQGFILRMLGRIEEAKRVYEEALRQYPNHVELLVALGNLCRQNLGDSETANRYFSQAYRLAPFDQTVVATHVENLLISRYGNEGEHIDLAYEIMCRFIDTSEGLRDVSVAAQSAFLRCAEFTRVARLGNKRELLKHWAQSLAPAALHEQLGRVETLQDRMDLLEAHRTWGRQIEAIAAAHPITRSGAAPHSRIRVGLMSSDLRRHAAMSFVSPFIEHYDKGRFELFCYSFSHLPQDDVQQWVARTADHFACWPNVPEKEIAQRMASDGLDILFDLGATTYMNKAEVLAWKPAPIQVSWLGYPHSCGLKDIDYLVVDPWVKPERAELILEKPLCMPETHVILGNIGFSDIPILQGIPQNRFPGIIFGTMNNPGKYTAQVLAVWARVMNQVPGSLFHFVRPEGGSAHFRQNILAHFEKHGVAANRIRFTPVRGRHLPYYNEIDIALDPFPHTGGATTCEALWMGVPTITLVGPSFFERLSYSNLTNAGLGDLCAFDIDSYVAKAVALSADPKRRLDLRHGLRRQIREHPLGQIERFIRTFEALVEKTLSKGVAS